MREVEALFERHGLGAVHAVETRRGGQINGVYLVNGRYVLRLRPAAKKSGAFATEEALFRRLRPRLPVPEVTHLNRFGTRYELTPTD